MKTQKKRLFSITGILIAALMSGQVVADDKKSECSTLKKFTKTGIPKYAYYDSDSDEERDNHDESGDDGDRTHSDNDKVTFCDHKEDGGFILTTLRRKDLQNHDDDYFTTTGVCPTTSTDCPEEDKGKKGDHKDYHNACSTLDHISQTIPVYAYKNKACNSDSSKSCHNEDDEDDSDHGEKVIICHNEGAGSTTPKFERIEISTHAMKAHLKNHNDYVSKTGVCPTTSVPCPPLTCTLPEVLNPTGTACITTGQLAVTPTVTPQSTTDTTPSLTGTVGTTALGSDTFTVKVGVNGATYYVTSGTPRITFSGTNNTIWTLQIATALPVATYDVIATRNGTTDTTTDELIIQSNPPSRVPTVTPLTTTITAESIIIAGTVGEVALVPDTFAVTVNNAAHPTNITGTLTVTGLTWAYTLTKPFYEGTFDVNAIRMVGGVSTPDTTHGELIITDKIDICNANVNQSINRSAWVGSKESSINYYMGKCNITGDSPLPPSFDNRCPLISAPPYVKVTKELCDNGGVKSDASINTVTVRQAQIVNASTENGTISGAISGKLKYGIKAENVGALELNNATVSQNQTTGVTLSGGVTLTGVTLTNASIDFADTTLTCTNSDGTWNVLGGTTKPTTTTTDGTINGTIVSGMITEGKDASGKPIRGNVTTGTYDSNITNLNNVTTKGRRVTGTLINATITNAQTTTINGQTFVLDGTITTGEMLPNTASTFGTVFNATLTNTNVSSTNHCFTSGTVGTRGQLNWKEVVKE
ncbi:MAG: hypothetical protein WCJ11_07380 [Methylococcaceae bacterium]